MARISIFVLYRIEAGELETCLTIAMSYFVYLMCESIEASGVIGVVLLGLTLNMNRACFSVSAIDISERTWQLLSYIANALIFMTVGVILLKTHSGTEKLTSLLTSIPQLLLVYIILTVVRALMIFSVHFILKRIAYGFTWKDATITIWSGLRGGVSLVLALTLFNSPIKDQYQAETLLIHTIAIVFLTCTGKNSSKRSILATIDFSERFDDSGSDKTVRHESTFRADRTNDKSGGPRSEKQTNRNDRTFEEKFGFRQRRLVLR